MKTKNNIILIITTVFIVFGYYTLEITKATLEKPNYNLKIEAQGKTQDAFNIIKRKKEDLGISIDENIDPHKTGIIGEGYNLITTTLGNLEIKQLSVNPKFAAIAVDMFTKLGLEEGDNIGLNFSSSFPAINIATIVAAETMKLNPIVMVSIGSSTYGANDPNFTYFDMEKTLLENNIIYTKSSFYSVGGENDIGINMDLTLLDDFFSNINLMEYNFINEGDYEKNIDFRYNFYIDNNVKAFVNVGGNIVAFGNDKDNLASKYGIIDENIKITEQSGLVSKFIVKKIPVISFLNIKGIGNDYNITSNNFNIYYYKEINKIVLFGMSIFGLFFLIRYVHLQKNTKTYDDVEMFNKL